jgi:hypothetical protein
VSARFVAVAVCGTLAGCDAAVTLTVAGDLPVPAGVDAMCVGVADHDARGGQFGRVYPLTSLPQTLAVKPGRAHAADAWVRGYRGGVVVARDAARMDFGGDVTLRLDACHRGRAGTAAVVATDPTAAARVVGSMGQGGAVAIAVGAAGARVLDADGGALVTPATFTPGAAPVDVIALDADGDCDDDVVIATDTQPPHLWIRGATDFADAGPIGTSPVRALAAADVDGDGDQDLITGAGGVLALYRNDGGGRFTKDPAAFGAGGGGATDVTTLAAGDLDGDGHADLVVGQGDAAPARLYALLGDGAGFASSAGVLPAVSVRAARATLVDADGDGDLDLVLALAGGPVRLYVNRAGVLEDQSFVRLPQPAPTAAAAAITTWDDDCAPDLALAASDMTTLARGADGGAFTADGSAPAASDLVFVDLDDDGAPDLVTAGPSGVAWVRR